MNTENQLLRGGVPGWQWVPVEPTPEMLAAADECWLKWENAHICTEVWPAMLTAAPQAPAAAPTHITWDALGRRCVNGVPETQPAPKPEPMTDDEMWALWNAQGIDDMTQHEAIAFARAVEAHHGITKEQA